MIRQQVEAVAHECEVLVVTGESSPSFSEMDTRVVPALGYDKPGVTDRNPERTADLILQAIRERWPHGCDVIHVHNPTLAKNRLFLKILQCLQARGQKLFLQIHDFAEDGRPHVYTREPYPSDCHYGVINFRDYFILRRAGLKKEGVHHIGNTINALDRTKPPSTPHATHVLYPVRCIRRKNIGEAILVALFLPESLPLLLTLPPTHDQDVKSYHGWQAFTRTHKLNVRFDAGLARSFSRLVQGAAFILTTSINEGFGFSFLEPWTAGKLVWGRRLPMICKDFTDQGVLLDHLYDHVHVPVAWVGESRVREAMETAWLHALKVFQGNEAPLVSKNMIDAVVSDGMVDFGMLHERFQKQVICRLISDPQARRTMIELNPFLNAPGDVAFRDRLIDDNHRTVRRLYTRARYGARLMEIYTRVSTTPVVHHLDKDEVLDHFLTPDNLSLLKWCAYDS